MKTAPKVAYFILRTGLEGEVYCHDPLHKLVDGRWPETSRPRNARLGGRESTAKTATRSG
jgi:hypothetical protein